MKLLAIIPFFSFIISGCNYKQLGCIICARYSSADTIRYQTGTVKSITLIKRIRKHSGMHGNVKKEVVTREFSDDNVLHSWKKEVFILTYKNFGKIMLAKDSLVYHQTGNSITHYVSKYKDGKLVSKSVISRKE